MGRTLAPSPFFGTLAGAWAIERCGSEEPEAGAVAAGCSGSLTLALAVADPNGDVNGRSGGATATLSGNGWRIGGRKSFVVESGAADKIVVIADVDGQQGFFLVDVKAAGIQIERLDWRDVTREVNAISFQDVAAERLSQADADSWPWIRDRLYLVLAAESAAGTERVLEDAVAYAKERIAFGRPIGSYQSIKHALADIAGGSELALAGVQYAAWALSEDRPDARKAVAIAQATPASNIAPPLSATSRSSARSASPGKCATTCSISERGPMRSCWVRRATNENRLSKFLNKSTARSPLRRNAVISAAPSSYHSRRTLGEEHGELRNLDHRCRPPRKPARCLANLSWIPSHRGFRSMGDRIMPKSAPLAAAPMSLAVFPSPPLSPASMLARHGAHHNSSEWRKLHDDTGIVFTFVWNPRSRCAGNREHHAPEYARWP